MRSKWKFYITVLATVLLAGLAESVFNALTYNDQRYCYLKAQLPKNRELAAICGPNASISALPSHSIYLDSAIYNTNANGPWGEAYVKATFIRHGQSWVLKSTIISHR
ncbi:hypothetical protein [Hymenobacter lucidus]|uniref:Uncharacterized protein n=1 Tax=Hymenobacter lucidus TaxID=2880930 RepID=A0ABS8AZH0_9BACT|nr:hypothetical protein [Hymenobacter lucidus]MCB2411204.1 hypothetical protein [Hymenobacter lucidus]